MQKIRGIIVYLIMVVTALFAVTSYYVCRVEAENEEFTAKDYIANGKLTIYNSDNKLDSMQINAIEQTGDGYLWIGSYSGLIRYDGNTFEEKHYDGINNVRGLKADEDDGLWVATNDKGVYYLKNGEVQVAFTADDGLPSNSVRAVALDADGNLYVGTAVGVCTVSKEDVAKRIEDETANVSIDTIAEDVITTVTSLCYSDEKDEIYGVSDDGVVYLIKDGKLEDTYAKEGENVLYTAVGEYEDGYILGDTVGNVYKLIDGKTEEYSYIKNMGWVNCVLMDSDSDGVFIGGDADFGYMSGDGTFTSFAEDDFSGSITGMTVDYQGNVWFSSSKQGLAKFCQSSFGDCFKKAGVAARVVNSATFYEGLLLAGCDDGFVVIDTEKNVASDELQDLQEELEGVRVRNIFVDSDENLWIATYGEDGLLCRSKSGKITTYNQANGSVNANFRSSIELSDGTIVAAGSEGITFIKDGKITGNLGEADGMAVPTVLTMVENDGSIYAGTNGDGIYVIKDGKIADHLDEEDGLDTLVILRIVKYKDGFIYVTSDSLYYDDTNSITRLDKFPYSNNYDVFINSDNKAWITSSKGIFVVDADSLVANTDYDYQLMNKNRGFDSAATANSWNYYDENGYLYLCTTSGIVKTDLSKYENEDIRYEIGINSIIADDSKELTLSDGKYAIPSDVNRIVVSPAVINYSLSNPIIEVYLDGFDKEGMTFTQDKLTDVAYSNLTGGKYKLHITIKSDADGSVLKDYAVTLVKKSKLTEMWQFQALLVFLACILISGITLLISKISHISELKQQYEETRLAKEEAERANNVKTRFLANMSHEIRTPINTITGMNEMILDQSKDEIIRQYAKNIESASNVLLSLVDGVLDFSQLESGKIEIKENAYSFKKIMSELEANLVNAASAKDLKYSFKVSDNVPEYVIGDESRVSDVYLNLITNAIKYTDEGSVEINVNCDVRDDSCIISFAVKDTGCGIKEENKDKIFEKFSKFEENYSGNILGTGLGLNLTKMLTEKMGGKLFVESEYGKGSTFTALITQKLPNDEELEKIRASYEEKNEISGELRIPDVRILAVDDNAMNLAIVRNLLKRSEAKLDTAASGQEGFELTRRNRYDVILMDHMMPTPDGIETLHMIKGDMSNKNLDTPVIVLTANAIEGSREKYINEGFADYMAKPMKMAELEKIVSENVSPELVTWVEPGDEEDTNAIGSAATATDQAAADITADATDTAVADTTATATGSAATTAGESTAETVENSDSQDMETHIDKEVAMNYCGGMEEIYNEIVGTYYDQGLKYKEKLNTLYPEKNWKECAIIYHAIKSTSMTIGAVKLSELAKTMELAAKADDEATIFATNDKFISERDIVLDIIEKDMLDTGEGADVDLADGDNNQSDKLSAEELKKIAESMIEEIVNFEMLAAEEKLDILKEQNISESANELIEKISTQLGDFDTDEAEKTARKLLEVI